MVDYKDLQREYERACQEAGGPLHSSGYAFNEQAPVEDLNGLNGVWGNREVAADRNAVDARTITNLPYRYEPGSGEIASQPRVPKIRG